MVTPVSLLNVPLSGELHWKCLLASGLQERAAESRKINFYSINLVSFCVYVNSFFFFCNDRLNDLEPAKGVFILWSFNYTLNLFSPTICI